MGQAKNRGDFSARQKEAIEAGRIKGARWVQQDPPLYVAPGHKPSLAQTLTQLAVDQPWSSQWADSTISAKPSEPFHQLSPGAERTAKDLSSIHVPNKDNGGL
jgi:hypothetical protein